MKRVVLLSIILMTFEFSKAQEVCVFNQDNELNLDSENPTALDAGTIIGVTESVVAKIGANDNYYPETFTATVNGSEITGGLRGTSNPKDEAGAFPANTLAQPSFGAFLKFDVKADGWLYIIIKARSNKAYTVFEDGEAIGYTFAAIGSEGPLPEVYSFTLNGAGRFNRLIDAGVEKVEFAEQEYLKVYAPSEYDSRWHVEYDGPESWQSISASGVGVIKVRVYKNCEYIVNANGAKIISCGFVFSPVEDVEIASNNTIILKAGNSLSPQPLPKCKSPEISVIDGKIKFSCETENVQYISEIEAGDANKYSESEINLSHVYKVKVYAYRSGYIRSDTITREFVIPGEGKGIFVGDIDGNGVVNVADHVELSKIIMNQ